MDAVLVLSGLVFVAVVLDGAVPVQPDHVVVHGRKMNVVEAQHLREMARGLQWSQSTGGVGIISIRDQLSGKVPNLPTRAIVMVGTEFCYGTNQATLEKGSSSRLDLKRIAKL